MSNKPVRGMKILGPDAFDDSDLATNGRLADRRHTPTAAADEEDDSDYEPPAVSRKGWSEKPSITDQATKVPASVRLGPPITVNLNLAVADDLAKLNDIQSRAHDVEGPFSAVVQLEKAFHAGAWYALLTHSTIYYQEL